MTNQSGKTLGRRDLLKSALAVTATNFGLPLLSRGSFQAFAAAPTKYSARAMKLVERSLVVDMLAVIVIDFRPEAYARTLTAEEEAMFRTSGITGFHNSIGTGGPQVVEETLMFLAAWQGFVGRHSHLFTLVEHAPGFDAPRHAAFIAPDGTDLVELSPDATHPRLRP